MERVTRSDVEKHHIPAKIYGMNVTVLDLVLMSQIAKGFSTLLLAAEQKVPQASLSSVCFATTCLEDFSEVEIGRIIQTDFYNITGLFQKWKRKSS